MDLPRHMVTKGRPGGKALRYWQPSASLRRLGFRDARLNDDEAIARREAADWNDKADAYRVAMATGDHSVRAGSLSAVVAIYKAHDDFLQLEPTTRRGYMQSIEIVGAALGDSLMSVITPPVVQAFKRTMTGTPWKANAALRVLRILFSFARREGYFKGENPVSKFKQNKTPARQVVWSRREEERFLEVANPEIRLAYLLAVWTAQREGDLLRLPWSAYDGDVITLRQSKTQVRLEIPASNALMEALDGVPRLSPVMLTTSKGVPWRADHFRHKFAEERDRAGLGDLRFSDLRRTSVVRLAEAGCTVPEIASISGHSIQTCQNIIDTYLPRTRNLARAEIMRMDRKDELGWKRESEKSETTRK